MTVKDKSNKNVRARDIYEKQKRGHRNALFRRTIVSFVVLFAIALTSAAGIYAYFDATVTTGAAGTLPAEFATDRAIRGDVINILVAGIDYTDAEGQGDRGVDPSKGLTDVIMYIHYDMKGDKMSILQIPRDTFVGTEYNTGNTFKINAIYPMAEEEERMAALAQAVNEMFALPIDYYGTINMDNFKDIVNAVDGVEMYIPVDIRTPEGTLVHSAGETVLLNGDGAELVVRARNYPQGDIDRLSVQQYFYGAIFTKFMSYPIGDIIKLMPYFVTFINTDMDLVTLGVLAREFVELDPANVIIAKMPGEGFNYVSPVTGNNISCYTGHLDTTADILNQYFRTYSEPVPAEELGLIEYQKTYESTEPLVQSMNGILAG